MEDTEKKTQVGKVFSVARVNPYIKGQAENNAELIVRAVNSHEALVEACKKALAVLECEAEPQSTQTMNQLRHALALAEGKGE